MQEHYINKLLSVMHRLRIKYAHIEGLKKKIEALVTPVAIESL